MSKKLILIADDEPAYGKILKNGLRKEGYDVIVVENGLKLLEIARSKKSVLILLDLLMPIKNGFEVLAELRKDEDLKNIKVIALSNLSQKEEIEKARKLGADDYIIKSDETFYSVIQRIQNILT